MIQLFRRFFNSKIGVVFTLAFLALIALAFAAADVTGTLFGGVAGGDRVAVVGDRDITTSELSTNVTSRFEAMRQQNPQLTMEAFVAQGGVEEVLEALLQRTAVAEFGREHSFRAGDRLIDSEIVQIPAFRGPTGSFDEDLFRAALSQRGLSEAALRDDIAAGLIAQQLITPVVQGASLPTPLARRYASLLGERREGAIATLPSTAFAPEGPPSDQQLQAYYQANRQNYIRPERRVIRYVAFDEEALRDLAPPSEAQIAERYQRDLAQYAAGETRTFTQLVVPTQDAAQEIVQQVRAGNSLEAVAQARGLATAQIGPVTQPELASETSPAVAQAAFDAGRGTIATPARGGLGWYVLQVDQVNQTPGRSLEQARGDIATALAEEQRRAAFLDLAERIEDDLSEGRSLSEIAQDLNLEVQTTRPLTANGQVYGEADATAPEVLRPALATAFEMPEGEPQLGQADAETFLVYEVARVTPSAAAPLNEVRDDVVQAWRREQGFAAAAEAAQRIVERVRQGATLAEAVRAEDVSLPAPDDISMTREQLAQEGQIPPVLGLFFSMAEGTVKRLAGPNQVAWFVASLDEIEVGTVAEDDPLVASTARELGAATADEYSQEFVQAARRQLGMEINEAAVEAVKAQLTGRSQP